VCSTPASRQSGGKRDHKAITLETAILHAQLLPATILRLGLTKWRNDRDNCMPDFYAQQLLSFYCLAQPMRGRFFLRLPQTPRADRLMDCVPQHVQLLGHFRNILSLV
jgi:hypothetical protein